MAHEISETRTELIRYLLEKVKQHELDPKLAVRFLKELEPGSPGSSSETEPHMEPIAVIGISCRFPDADGPDQFWDNIASGKNSIKPFPPSRMDDFERNGGDRSRPMQLAGFLDAVDCFDPEYFQIPPRAAEQMDPYHRLLLLAFIEAIEDAGYHRGQLQGKRIGVFVGNDHTHRFLTSYLSFLPECDFNALIGSWTGVLASRLSYTLNLRGPAMVIDTACSSSLVAIDSAIKSMRHGDCEAALIGGVNLIFYPDSSQVDVQSADYKVCAFDKDASGTAWGEGAAAVMLKPLAKARRDRDHIYGIIRGVAVNNDGASNGLTAPSARAQQEVLTRAWQQAGIAPETLSYIETHGTGTSLGDPIEIKGIADAFASFTDKRQFCSIGSVKSNIGHTVGVAGLASLIKVLLALRERSLPPSINFKVPNPLIDFCNSPVYVQDCLSPWPGEEGPRRAGVSAFSLSGTNVHLVVEEAPMEEWAPSAGEWGLFILSGRSPELLARTAERCADYLQLHPGLRREDACYTACVGREPHPFRAAVLSRDRTSLIEGLRLLSAAALSAQQDGEPHAEGRSFYLFLGSDRDGEGGSATSARLPGEGQPVQEIVARVNGQPDDRDAWKALGSLYVRGVSIPWNKLFEHKSVQRCSLPPQPFALQRYWSANRRGPAQDRRTPAEPPQAMNAEALWAQVREAAPRLQAVPGEPQDEIQVLAAWIWSEVLGYPIIREQDDFHELGGDSILGLQVVQLLNLALGADFSVSLLFEDSRFELFVEQVRVKLKDKLDEFEFLSKELAPPPIEAARSPFPVSFAQNRMFLSAHSMPDSLAYNVTEVIRIEQAVSPEQVQEILRCLIKRHDSLRTSFHVDGEETVQTVHPHVDFHVSRIELTGTSGSTGEELLQEALKGFIRPFDLSQAPLMRAGYFFTEREAYLAIDMHHIITDGTSMGIFFEEYNAMAEGRELSPVNCTYREAVNWLRQRMSESSFGVHRQWWLEQFADGIPALNLPADKPRPSVRNYKGARVFHTLPHELNRRLKDLAKASKSTLFMVLLAGFHNLLAKLGADRDIVIGTPVSGRQRIEFSRVIGMFVNTLPLRTRSAGDESFAALLQRLRKLTLEAYDHQEYPYEILLEDLKPARIPGHNPLFDVYFALQNINMGLPEDERQMIPYESGSAKFDLTVTAREAPDGLIMEWEYAESLFQRSTIERIARRFEILLSAIADNPDRPLADYELMEPEEQRMLLIGWNQTAAPFPGARGIVPLFEEWVQRQGHADALLMDGRRMSYHMLNQRSNQIARGIQNAGVRPGSAVALLLNRSFDMIASMLAVLKAGCHYIPLDTASPAGRLLAMMTDGAAKLLITHENLGEMQTGEITKLHLDDWDPGLADHNLGLDYSGDQPAYIIYTSGSTGAPKGALIRQESVIRVVRNAGYFTFYPEDVVLQLSNYAFDGAVFDIFGALLNGAGLALLPRHEAMDPVLLGRTIRDAHVSVFFITAPLFNALVETNPDCLEHTRMVLFGGDRASAHHVKRAYERLGPGRLINGYGPTETTVFAACHLVQSAPEEDVAIGKAVANTTLYVFDPDMRLQPIGVPGELYIGGPGLAEEYVNQPELTAERFVMNPYIPGERLYRTGDRVKWGEDGNLRYLGRLDQQLKLRGFRIEAAEIEAHALKHPGVREAHACVLLDAPYGGSLCLWAVPEGDMAAFDSSALKQRLVQSLPEYMVPAFIVPVPALPLNKNGKIDKDKLARPEQAETERLREPRTDNESLLAAIWADVLGVRRVGVEANFFSLGGDSIKAIQVIARVQAAGLGLSMEKIFQLQTVQAIAAHLEQHADSGAEQGEVSGYCPPSAIQAWFLRATSRSVHFNQAMWISLRKEYSASRLADALTRLCHHHDMLRLALSDEGNLSIRGYEAERLYHLAVLPAGTDKLHLREELLSIQRQMDLRNGPIVAAGIASAQEGTGIFLAIHHLAVDVVSWGVILEDLLALLDDPEAELPRKTASFPAWTKALTDWAANGGANDELPYWRAVADEALGIRPALRSEPAAHGATAAIQHWIGGTAGQAVCGSANDAYHTDTAHLLLLILARALGRWRSQPAVLMNLEGHGREAFQSDMDISRTAGWFTSSFPVLLKGEGEVGEAIKSVKETIRAIPRRGFGFGVLSWLTPELSAQDRAALDSLRPAVNVNYLGVQENGNGRGAQIEVMPADITVDENMPAAWTLDIIASQVNSAVCLELRYPASLFSEQELKQLLTQVDDAAAEVALHCANRAKEKTASDYAAAGLEQSELERIWADLEITP